MTRQAVFIVLCLLFAATSSSFSFVHALLGGCDDIEKDFKFEKALREKCNKELEEANQRAADADDVKRQLVDCENAGKKLKNDIEKLKKEKEYAKGEATDYENMLIREQSECRKKDKRCKASEEQLQQTQNKLTECEDKLIDCGGTQSVQAKKHVEFLKGQINDLKKHRDRLEVELEETQTSFRNLRYTETICQSNYSDLVQQLSEYKNRIQSLQNENQACQKIVGTDGALHLYYDHNLLIHAVAVIIIISLLFWNISLRESEKYAMKLLESEKKHICTLQQPVKSVSQSHYEKKKGKAGYTEDGELFSSDNGETDENEDDHQDPDAANEDEDKELKNHAGSSQVSSPNRTGSNQKSHLKTKGEDKTSVSGGTAPTKGGPLTKLEEPINTNVDGLEEMKTKVAKVEDLEKKVEGLGVQVEDTANLKTLVEGLKAKVGDLEERVNKLGDEVTAGKEETDNLKTKVKELEGLKTNVAKVGGLEKEVKELGVQVSAGKEETDNLKTKVEGLEGLKTNVAKVGGLEKEVKELGDEVSAGKEETDNLKAKVEGLEGLKTNVAKVGGLEKEVKELGVKVSAGKEETDNLKTKVKELEGLKTNVAKVGGLEKEVKELGDEGSAGKEETDNLKAKVEGLEEKVVGFGDAGEKNALNTSDARKPTIKGGQAGEGAGTGKLTSKKKDFDVSKNRKHSAQKVLETGASVHQSPATAEGANLHSPVHAKGNREPGFGSHGDDDSHGQNAAVKSDPAVTDQDKSIESSPIGGVSPPQDDTLSNSSEKKLKANDFAGTPV